tara:strand:- start:1978 stop:2211 length:234 start_codon:yes stop_codon:yes gene_type:complete
MRNELVEYLNEWLQEQDSHTREAVFEIKDALFDALKDSPTSVELQTYMKEWLSEQDIHTLEAWNEIHLAIWDALYNK